MTITLLVTWLASSFLLRSGDVHPQPGPVHIVSANITSMHTYCQDVASWLADIIAVQETRLTLKGQQVMAGILRERGWGTLWGQPMPAGSAGVWHSAPGGVGLLARSPWAMKLVVPAGDNELGQSLWQSTRWMHAYVTTGDGKGGFNIQVVYGILGNARLGKELLTKVLEYSAGLGNAPSLIAADFNINLDRYDDLPHTLSASLTLGDWVDLDALWANLHGTPLCATTTKSIAAHPTRIDGVWASRRTARLLAGVATIPSTLPCHDVVCYTMLFDAP